MIEGNELRLGNHVFVQGVPRELTKQMFKVAVITLNCQDIEPIPLTKEWLLKFGFERSVNGLWKFPLEMRSNGRNGFHCFYGNSSSKRKINIEIKSVHQLQNLYFALTGEELEIK